MLVYFCRRFCTRFSHTLGQDTSPLLRLRPAAKAGGLLLLPILPFKLLQLLPKCRQKCSQIWQFPAYVWSSFPRGPLTPTVALFPIHTKRSSNQPTIENQKQKSIVANPPWILQILLSEIWRKKSQCDEDLQNYFFFLPTKTNSMSSNSDPREKAAPSWHYAETEFEPARQDRQKSISSSSLDDVNNSLKNKVLVFSSSDDKFLLKTKQHR